MAQAFTGIEFVGDTGQREWVAVSKMAGQVWVQALDGGNDMTLVAMEPDEAERMARHILEVVESIRGR
jgi:hypothetical protein